MSVWTEGTNADIATFRQIQYDDQHKNSRGEKTFRLIPWQYVEYSKKGTVAGATTGGVQKPGASISGWEPIDALSVNERTNNTSVAAFNPSKHATSIQFQDEGSMFSRVGVGGDVFWPRG
jgi:hypothetical protein